MINSVLLMYVKYELESIYDLGHESQLFLIFQVGLRDTRAREQGTP